MKVHTNGGGHVAAVGSPDKKNKHVSNNDNSGSDDVLGIAVPTVLIPKFVIGLSNKEKEEDFMAIKGSKLPQRPKKRAKHVQLSLNAVNPGAWLCNLSLDRYDVKGKKTSKKRLRGLKAMGNIKDSDSEQQQQQ